MFVTLRWMMPAAALTLCLSVAGALAAPAPVTVDRVVAVVNNEVITLSDLQRELLKRTDVTDQKLMLEEMIDRKLQMWAAKRNGMAVSEKELNDAMNDIMLRNKLDAAQFETALAKEGLTLEQYRMELKEQMTMSRLFNKFVRSDITVTEAEIKAYYDKNAKLYSLPEEFRVRHLVVAVPAGATPAADAEAKKKAEELLARARKGGDFVKLIRDHSEGPTAKQGGDLGFLQRGQAIPEIEEAAKDLKPGEYAGPVKCEDGYHVIRVEEIRTPVRPYEKVKDEIQKTLFEQKMENTYRAFLQSLRTESHIENRL